MVAALEIHGAETDVAAWEELIGKIRTLAKALDRVGNV